MINAKRANALLWTGNLALIIGIASITLNSFILREPSNRVVESHDSLPLAPPPNDVRDTGPLSSLPNPIRDTLRTPQNEAVCLIGIDGIAGDPNAATAYLFLAGRNLFLNAYVGEPIREGATGREVSELSGWRLKAITSKGALFLTPKGELILDLAQGRALLATATSSPSEAHTLFDVAAELFKDGRVEEACVVLEVALLLRPTSDVLYAFIKRVGEDVVASMMNSRHEKLRAIGWRLFELAKPGGERRRPSNA